MPIPQYPLCKFGTVDGAIKMLAHNCVFISSPMDLNDSFEMRPQWTQELQDDNHVFQAEKEHMLAEFPMIDATDPGNLKIINPKKAPRKAEPNEFNPKISVDQGYGLAESHNFSVAQYIHETYRVLSLVENVIDTTKSLQRSHEGDVLMWAHYGDQFQGAALLLDPEHFPNGLENPTGQRGFPINYQEKRLSLPSWIYHYLSIHPSPLIPAEAVEELDRSITSLLTTKSELWRYERELRMLYPMDTVTTKALFPEIEDRCPECKEKGKAKEQCENHCYRDAVTIDAKAIIGVVFGPEVAMQSLSQIASILRQPKYEHLKLYRSSHNDQEYRMDYIEDSLENIETFQNKHCDHVGIIKNHLEYNSDGSKKMMSFGARKTINLKQRRPYPEEPPQAQR